MNDVSMHGWRHMGGVIARNIESGGFEKLPANIPLPDQRKTWATARSDFFEAERAALDRAPTPSPRTFDLARALERFPVMWNHLTTRQNAANQESRAFPDPVRSGNALGW